MLIKAAVVEGKDEPFRIEELELRGPMANEVLVRVVATGVCHTDTGAQRMSFPTNYPIVLGHEASGIVEDIGSGVNHVKKGDHVVLSYCFCGQCPSCLDANPGGCTENGRLNFGGRMEDGTFRLFRGKDPIHSFFGQASFATYAVANQKNVVVVDKDVDLALLGPLGCGILTGAATVLNGIKPEFDTSIAIFGCGAVGLSAIMAAKLAPCATIIAVDVVQSRLDLARELGATHVINGRDGNVAEQIRELTGGVGVHYAIEASGVAPVFRQALNSVKSAGKLVVVAVGHAPLEINVSVDILFPTRTIQGMIEGSVMPQAFIPKIIDFYKKGLFPFDRLIDFFPFEKINEAFAAAQSGASIKPVLKM